MKRKAGLIIAAVFALGGIILCTAAVFAGVRLDDLRWHTAGTAEQSEYEFKDIESLDIELDVTDMQIVTGNGDKIKVMLSDDNGNVRCHLDGKTLEITDSGRNGIFWLPWVGRGSMDILLEIPEGFRFEETELNVGAGDVQIENLDTKNLEIECGVGSIDLSGIIRGNADLDCGVGEIRMSLAQKEQDFDYNIDCGVGEISVGSMDFDGLGAERKVNNGASQKINVDCGVGSINITFEE